MSTRWAKAPLISNWTSNRVSSRMIGIVLGAILVLYASAELLMEPSRPDDRLKAAFCSAWLCPLEFSPQRVFHLKREVFGKDSQHALAELKRAVELDPGSAYAWANLGEAYASIRQSEPATNCFQRALALAPNSAPLLVRASNLYFSLGDTSEVMRCMYPVLKNPDLVEYYFPAFLTYRRMGIPLADILNKGLPPAKPAAQSFLRLLMGGGRVTDSLTAWGWMAQHRLTDRDIETEYLNFLVGREQEQAAARIWAESNPDTGADYQKANWIFNGGFESEPQPALFDWHIGSNDDVTASRTSAEAHDGHSSLQLEFAGENNVDYHDAYQRIAVTPGKWRLEGFIKTDKLTTDHGIVLRVFDAANASRLDIKTEMLTGDRDWTKVERSFTIGPQTRLVRVEVAREPSSKLDNKVGGRGWVDSVTLSPLR